MTLKTRLSHLEKAVRTQLGDYCPTCRNAIVSVVTVKNDEPDPPSPTCPTCERRLPVIIIRKHYKLAGQASVR